jgi:excisionase family DNA binding protein
VAEKEFLSFEEALKELRLKEEELKRLVSEGEIRAFREGETMKLRKSDVQNLRNELSGGEVVELGGASEELVFEDDTDLDAGMATEEIAQADTILEDDVEEVAEIEVDEPAPVVRTPRRAVAVVEEPSGEGMAMKIVMVLTAVVLFLALPVAMAATSGHPSGIARSIANLFGANIP